MYTYYLVGGLETMDSTPKYEQYDKQQKAYLRAERLRVESKAEKIKSKSLNSLHKTLTFTISQWALLEQVREKMHLDDFNQTLNFCILEQARVLEIES